MTFVSITRSAPNVLQDNQAKCQAKLLFLKELNTRMTSERQSLET